jgi:hypothetical protein
MALLAQPTARRIGPEKVLVGGNDSAAWEFFLQQATTAPGAVSTSSTEYQMGLHGVL